MKTYKNLYPEICSFGNLCIAFYGAARGKRGKAEVAAFEGELEPNLFRLQEALLAQTYRPGPYTHFPIRDPKPRVISAAPFRDRVVHHALVGVIEPIFEARFIHDSYACRVGRAPTGRWIAARRSPAAIHTCCSATWFISSPAWTTPSCVGFWPAPSLTPVPSGWWT